MTMPNDATEEAPERGCGATRTVDGVYLEVGTSPYGRPFDDFLICPPVLLPEGMTVATLANKNAIWRDPNTGISHIMIWVGESFYPYLPDYLEESRRYGISRKISPLTDFSQLTSASRMMMVHPKAYNANWAAQVQPEICGCNKPGHALYSAPGAHAGPCLYKLFDLMPTEAGSLVPDETDSRGYQGYQRQIGSTRYLFHPTQERHLFLPTPEIPHEFLPAVFGIFAPTNIALICDKDGSLGPNTSTVKDKLDKLGNLPYSITDH